VRVLYITPGCFDKGGISRYNRFQIRALQEILGAENVEVYSLLPRQRDDLEESFDVAWAPKRRLHALNKVRLTAKVVARALAWKPQLIWTAHINLSVLALSLARSVGAEVVLNTYGLEVWSGVTRMKEFGLRRADHVISDCHFTANYLEISGYRNKGSVKVIWDTVDVERFSPGEPAASVIAKYGLGPAVSGINLVTLGRMSTNADHKGYRRLLEAFSIAARQVPSLHLSYAGSGDLVEVLRARAQALNLSDRVHFAGSIHEADLPDVYRTGDIFALISDRGNGRGEGVPVTPLEAAACGVPILVGNQDGSPEAVAEGENGYVLDSLDVAAHARAIVQLADAPDVRVRMGRAGARRVQAEFSYPRFCDKHRQFVQSLIGA
jgi:phosphatidylinositol alpha-1,6-mannosyltransferase